MLHSVGSVSSSASVTAQRWLAEQALSGAGLNGAVRSVEPVQGLERLAQVTAGRTTNTAGAGSISEAASNGTAKPSLEQAFQDFAAGTFYSEMLKALRKTEHKPAYLYGGMAEDMFRAQLDQTVAEDLAAKHGKQFAGPLFAAFAQRLRLSTQVAQP